MKDLVPSWRIAMIIRNLDEDYVTYTSVRDTVLADKPTLKLVDKILRNNRECHYRALKLLEERSEK
jgi:hypothetical protein